MKKASVNTMGKPTEMTSAPQPPRTRHSVMDGIVKGVPRGMRTPMPDGVITGLAPKMTGHVTGVAPSATRLPTQEFGSVPFQMSAFGR